MEDGKVIIINRGIDLCYSPDDGGWYFLKYGNVDTGVADLTSGIYASKGRAMTAFRHSCITWE